MIENPTPTPGSSRPDGEPTPVHFIQELDRSALTVSPACASRPSDRRLLSLMGEHQVLTTGQLVRLTGMPERTVQHRLGVLYRSGLVNRHRPRSAVGTAPYHCWLTAFGAAAAGVGPPIPWHEDPAGVRTTAGMSDLWLGLRNTLSAGLTVQAWRRLHDGFILSDGRTGAQRKIPADAELSAGVTRGGNVRALLFARLDRIPAGRLGPVLARWADCLRPPPSASPPVAILVLTAGHSRRCVVLDVARSTGAVAARMAVAVAGGHPAALATGAVWQTPNDGVDRSLLDVLASIVKGGR
jgi:hypothetical protein